MFENFDESVAFVVSLESVCWTVDEFESFEEFDDVVADDVEELSFFLLASVSLVS